MSNSERLNSFQQQAIAYVTHSACEHKQASLQSIRHIFHMCHLPFEQYEEAKHALLSHARVALHFHPDRLDRKNISVVQALLEQGVYRSQYETGLSNGSLSAYPGGDRDRWEQALFGQAYHAPEVAAEDRPKYGALHWMNESDGPAPRFGSCYLLLKPEVNTRCTFTYLDSHSSPAERGSVHCFDQMMNAIFSDAFVNECVLGSADVTPYDVLDHLLDLKRANDASTMKQYPTSWLRQQPARKLNHYIEAQVHGKLDLSRDVSCLVIDPSFRNTVVGEQLAQLSRQYHFPLEEHPGFHMSARDVPDNFRGPSMPSLAERIAQEGEGTIHAAAIGEAVRQFLLAPDDWSDRGSREGMLQQFKYLWHTIVKFGDQKRE